MVFMGKMMGREKGGIILVSQGVTGSGPRIQASGLPTIEKRH